MANLIVCTGNQIEVSGVPTEIKILPLGLVHSQKGDFEVDNESFEMMQKQFKDRCLDLVIDYEHQTLADVQAPAGGWIKDLYLAEDSIMAKVEWTPKGAEYLKNKEYKYLSPVVLVRKKDQKATVLHSVALTNTPAIDGMFPLVNSLDIEDYEELEGEKNIMDLKELAKLLGLAEDAPEEEIKKAVAEAAKAKEKEQETEKKEAPGATQPGDKGAQAGQEVVANSTILSMLGLQGDAKTEDVAATIMTLKAGGADIQRDFLALKEKLIQKDADELVQNALKTGKISAAQKEWAMEYALKNQDGFKKFLEKAPAVVPVGQLELKDAPEMDAKEVDPLILKNSGVSAEDCKKYAKKGE